MKRWGDLKEAQEHFTPTHDGENLITKGGTSAEFLSFTTCAKLHGWVWTKDIGSRAQLAEQQEEEEQEETAGE